MTKSKPVNDPLKRQPTTKNPPRDAEVVPADSFGKNPMARTEINISQYQGPIPPPELLREYESIVPGSADRIITVMENQVAHRISMQRTVITGDNIRAYLGLAAGFIITLVVLGLSAWLIVSGYALAGTVLGTIDLVSLASIFVYAHHSRKQERQEKRQQTQEVQRGKKRS